jgi:peroxiredoxin
MKNQFAVFILFIVFVLSCKNDKNTCHLKGKLENAPETTTLFLVDWQSNALFDSMQINKGIIDHKFQIKDPIYFLIHNKINESLFRDKKFVWLEPNEINVSGDFNFMKNIVFSGSDSQNEFESFNLLKTETEKIIYNLQEQIHFKTIEEQKTDTLKIDSLKIKLNDEITAFLMNHPNSYVTLNTLHDECYNSDRNLNKVQIQKIYNELPETLKKTEMAGEIKKYIELPEPPKVGDIAPEIIQVTSQGDTIKLSDYRGKYVLLDFWASWCAPCRVQNKWLRKIFSQYNSKGFEILMVSGDYNKQEWINAIEHDSIPWINISDLKGWKNEAFLWYDIKGIPDKFLINPEGVIINDRNGLYNESVTNQVLEQIFESKPMR